MTDPGRDDQDHDALDSSAAGGCQVETPPGAEEKPLDWWEMLQVGLLVEHTRVYRPDYLPVAEYLRAHPSEWRAFRARLKEIVDAG